MNISELIAQLQAIQATHGPDVLVLRERENELGFVEVGSVETDDMWPMREGNDNFLRSGDAFGEQDYEARWASYDDEPEAPDPTFCVYLD
jgi:hypothetical protein